MRVLLGVSGGIAAYKAAILVRRLQESGHEVRCALTRTAPRFVSPLTLEVLTGHAVYSESYLVARGKAEEEHITAARCESLNRIAHCLVLCCPGGGAMPEYRRRSRCPL